MARNQHAGPSTLRNRNRVTNKTRLKVIKESIDADPIVLDEDEEKARVVSTAGVDAEDANEHHLQAVLSAAASRHHTSARSTRGTEKEAPAAYIPTPDSTGKVDNYEDSYPPDKWRDPITYVKSSDSVEESTSFALAGGIIYYMDERDKEWLDKINEEARGEGPSKRPSRKGKDPEVVPMTEDEFELVMAIFEKVTHAKAEFLHHNFQDVPPFTDYEDTFGQPLQPTLFAIYEVPTWIPPASQLLRYAKMVYPHWRSRRTLRDGHPIIPVVNLDESDTKNESYICFRRRESKAVRKTRAQQATYSDKMIRLQSELATAMELARGVLQREAMKRDVAIQGKAVWEKRFVAIDLKRKFPSLGTKEDDELFQDKERVPKKVKPTDVARIPIKLRTGRDSGDFGSPVVTEPMMRPAVRASMIQAQVEEELAKRKDHRWEDAVDNPYQPLPTQYGSRLFKYIATTTRPSSSSSSESAQPHDRYRATRLRFGRGGRRYLDRRLPAPRPRTSFSSTYTSDSEEEEALQELKARWKYDNDDGPAIGPDGPDEQDRVLIDDFEPRYIAHGVTLLSEEDTQQLATDPSFTIVGQDGRSQQFVPFRHPMPLSMAARQANINRYLAMQHQQQALAQRQSNGTAPPGPASSNGAAHPQAKGMLPPQLGVPQARVSSNGAMRPPTTPTVPAIPTAHASPPQPSGPAMPNGTTPHDQSNHVQAHPDQEMKIPVSVPVQAVPQTPAESNHADAPVSNIAMTSPVRPKSQTPTMTAIPNGFTIPSVNNYSTHIVNGASFPHHNGVRTNGLNNPQLIKSAFASLATNGDNGTQGHIPIRQPATSYIAHNLSSSPNYPAQLAAARQMQWASIAAQQRAPTVNVVDTNGVDNTLANGLSPPIAGVPQRVPSANGTHGIPLSRGISSPAIAQAMAVQQGRSSPANAHLSRLTAHPHSPNLLSPGMVAAQPHTSPPRPQSHMPSPSLQSRQILGSSGVGF